MLEFKKEPQTTTNLKSGVSPVIYFAILPILGIFYFSYYLSSSIGSFLAIEILNYCESDPWFNVISYFIMFGIILITIGFTFTIFTSIGLAISIFKQSNFDKYKSSKSFYAVSTYILTTLMTFFGIMVLIILLNFKH